MSRPSLPLALALLLFQGSASALAASGADTPGERGRSVAATVARFDALPRAVERPDIPTRPIHEGEVPMGEAAMEQLKRRPGPDPSRLSHLTLDANGGFPGALAPTPGIGFESITQNGYIPSEPTSAVGPTQVFSPGNITVTVTDKDGSNRVEVDGAAFFGAPAAEGAISDAVSYFDALRGRFLALCFTQGNAGGSKWSYFYLAISQTSDARGLWWRYRFDQRLDGSTLSNNWSDFEGLGVSDDKLAMSSQQFSFGGNMYQYQKIRVIDRALAYAGQPVTTVDLFGFAAPPGGDVSNLFVTKVGRNLGAGDATIHVFTVRYNGGSNVAYRTLTGPPSAPVLSAGNLVTVSAYSAPPDAVQPESSHLVPTGDCRTPEFTVRNGVLTVAWHTGVTLSGTTYSGVRLFRMRTSDRVVLTDETYAAAGSYYYYPAATADSVGTVFLGFDRSSATVYPSSYATGKRRTDATLQPSALLKAGNSPTSQSRWGDYTGIDLDTFASGPSGTSVWYAGQWNKGPNLFGTWITKLTFTYGVIDGIALEDCDGNAATTADRAPIAGVSLTLKQGATTVASTTSDAAGHWTFGYVETGLYDVLATPPAGGAAVDAVPGAGGNLQTRISSTDLQIALNNAQTSAANGFVVASPRPAPLTAGLAPATKTVGDPAFTLTVDGSGFTRCSVVRLDGADRATSFVSGTQLTASIPAGDLAAPGTRSVTVFTPGPGGGLSNPQNLTVNPVATYTLSVGVTGPGAVARSPDQPAYGAGTVVQLTALPDSACAFGGWSGGASGTDNPLAVTMNGNQSVTAAFSDVGPPHATVLAPNGGETFAIGSSASLQWTALDNLGVSGVDLFLSRDGAGGTYELIAAGAANTGSFGWSVTGPASADAVLKVLAHDAAGLTGEDVSDAPFGIAGTAAVEAAEPRALALAPVRPNPARGAARIDFALPHATEVRLSVLDLNGREVAVLAQGEMDAGPHAARWDGRRPGSRAPAGLYFVRLEAAGRTLVRRMALIW